MANIKEKYIVPKIEMENRLHIVLTDYSFRKGPPLYKRGILNTWMC